MTPLTERDYIGLTLWGEARGESLDGKLAVASVLRNRKAAGRWGATYEAVCLARKQFSCWNANDPNYPQLRVFCDQLSDGVTPSDPALRACLWIADGLLGGFFPSPVSDACHYFAASMRNAPAWASTGEYVGTIGRHLFFRGVR